MTAPVQPRSLEQILAEQANEAMKQGADPKAASDMLGRMVRHIRANPALSQQGADAIAQGADPGAVASTVWQLAQGSQPSAAPKETGPAVPAPGVLETMGNMFMHPMEGYPEYAARKRANEGGLLARAGHKIAEMATGAVTHPERLLTAPVEAAANIVAPSIEGAEQLNNDKGFQARNVARFGREVHSQGVTGAERASGIAQTAANIALPGITSGVGKRLVGAGVNKLLANAGGVAAGGSVVGAAGDLRDPLAGGLAGLTMGAGLGATVPPIVRAAKSVGTGAVDAMGLRPSGLTAQEASADAAAMRQPSGPQATPRTDEVLNGATPVDKIRAFLAKRVEKGIPVVGGIESAKTRALREVAHRFNLDNVTPADATAFASRAGDKPVAVLDLGEGNVAGLARTAKDVPSLARKQITEFLNARGRGTFGDEGQTLKRVTGDIERQIGLAPEDYYASLDDMVKRQKSQASADYGPIRNTVVDDPEVLALFDEPEFRTIHDAIRRNARLRGQDDIPPLRDAAPVAEQAEGAAPRDVLNPQTLGTLDKMKRHIDQIIAGKIDGGPIQRDAAQAMGARLDEIRNRLDEIVPAYGKARANYGGSAELMDAYEQGKQDFWTLDPRAIKQKMASMSERTHDLYRRGGYDDLMVRLRRMDDASNIGAFLEKNPDIRERVAVLAKEPGQAVALRGDLNVERAMGDRKNQILGGPNTAERLIEHGNTVPRVTHVGNLARMLPGVGKLAGGLVDNAVTRRTAGHTADVMGEVGKIMTRSGKPGIDLTMSEIRQLMESDAGRQQFFSVLGNYLGAQTAALPKR